MAAPEVVISDLIVKQVAAAAATGASVQEISNQLTITKYQVRKIMAGPRFKAVVREIGDDAVNNAKQVIRAKTGELAHEVSRVLKERLEDNDLEAVKVALKIMGFEQQEQVKGDTQIVVQLPGTTEKAVEAEFSPVIQEDTNADTGH